MEQLSRHTSHVSVALGVVGVRFEFHSCVVAFLAVERSGAVAARRDTVQFATTNGRRTVINKSKQIHGERRSLTWNMCIRDHGLEKWVNRASSGKGTNGIRKRE